MSDEIHVHHEEETGVRGGAAAAYAPTEVYAHPVAETAVLVKQTHWGGIWGGFLSYIAIWLWFSAIGFAIWLGAARTPATAFGPGYAVWVGVAGIVAIFIGAVIMSRIAPITNAANGVWNGVVLWGLSFTLLLLMALLGVGGALATIFGTSAPAVRTASSPGLVLATATTSAWLFVVFEFLSLLAAIGGGAAGIRSAEEEETRTTT